MRSDDHIRAEAETIAVLRVLSLRPEVWHTHDSDGTIMPSVDPAFPANYKTKQKLARLRRKAHKALSSASAWRC